MSVQARLEREQRFERERAVLHMRSAVVAALAQAYIGRVGSSAVFEAVDEALAQIVATGAHLGEPDEVKALWVTAARRRIIDEQRSAESKYRGAGAVDEAPGTLADGAFAELDEMAEDGRARWRIREILSVLRGDQRRWAEAWFDEVLSSGARGGQPRGLHETLGWTRPKTKTVSRRARSKMVKFIEARTSGAVCRARRAQLDALILADRHGREIGDAPYAAVLFHVAGCDECRAAWHARRRTPLGRGPAIALVPFDAVAATVQTCGVKVAGFAASAHAQASTLLTRLGIGGAAAAGGGAATLGGKTAAVCVGVACAAAAGGEVAVVLAPGAREPRLPMPVRAVPVERAERVPVIAVRRVTREIAPAAAPVAQARVKQQVRKALAAPKAAVARATPGDLPAGGGAPAPASAPRTAVPAPPAASPRCTPGDLRC